MFTVPLIQHTGDRQVTLAAIKHSLECLDQTAAGILTRIQAKIHSERERFELIKKRMEAVNNRILALQQDKSKALVLTSMSSWPDVVASSSPMFADVSLQKLDLEPSEIDSFFDYPNLRWQPAQADGDPFVPLVAIAELERRFKRAHYHLSTFSAVSLPPSSSFQEEHEEEEGQLRDGEEDEDLSSIILGQTPNSLLQEFKDEDESVYEVVGYRPSVKEARQLGLPSNLNLPDIALPLVTRLPANLNLPDIASTPIKPTISSPRLLVSNQPNLHSLSEDSSNLAGELPSSSVSTLLRQPLPQIDEQSTITTTTTPPPSQQLDEDPIRRSLLDAIRGEPGKSRLRESKPGQRQISPSKPGQLSLADEMREKLLRRQKALSGERDEEEQMTAGMINRKKQSSFGEDEEESSASSTSLPPAPALPKRLSNSKREKRNREPLPPKEEEDFLARRFAGIDVLLTRELAKLPAGGKKPSTATKSVLSGGSEWDAR